MKTVVSADGKIYEERERIREIVYWTPWGGRFKPTQLLSIGYAKRLVRPAARIARTRPLDPCRVNSALGEGVLGPKPWLSVGNGGFVAVGMKTFVSPLARIFDEARVITVSLG
ncbi:hypothetical protein PS723_02427 [Pseudomonas fluorescens]|uniref:Uncharacterized protein n=1 Tax=Pseudomonas fluorescens TaxID=294 RepID=A0A5E7C1A9_PSEFL|nr:hypothetical protein PS723_02427 [Pseudomonas fluorescens]